MDSKKPTTTAPAPDPKRTEDEATKIGRIVRAFLRIERDRDADLADAPKSINERAAKRLSVAADGNPPHVVAAARAAVEAMRPKETGEA